MISLWSVIQGFDNCTSRCQPDINSL